MPVHQKTQQLNRIILPPGASFAFGDWLNKLNGVTKETADVADGAEKTATEAKALAVEAKEIAVDAKSIAEAQRVRNDEQDVTLSLHDQRITSTESRLDVVESDVDYLLDQVVLLEGRIENLEDWRVYMTRQKSEVTYSGISLPIPTTPSNLLTLLGTLTPTSGSLTPFFDTATGKMTALAKDLDLKFKLSIRGSFAGGTGNRSMQLTFNIAVPDTLVQSRNAATSVDDLLFSTWFSVDAGGELATSGTTITIRANGGAFTATQIKIIASQS